MQGESKRQTHLQILCRIILPKCFHKTSQKTVKTHALIFDGYDATGNKLWQRCGKTVAGLLNSSQNSNIDIDINQNPNNRKNFNVTVLSSQP